jgi:hypothetical protein
LSTFFVQRRGHGRPSSALLHRPFQFSPSAGCRRDRKQNDSENFFGVVLPGEPVLFFVFDVARLPKRTTRFYFSGLVDRMIGGGWDLEGASWSDPLSLQAL